MPGPLGEVGGPCGPHARALPSRLTRHVSPTVCLEVLRHQPVAHGPALHVAVLRAHGHGAHVQVPPPPPVPSRRLGRSFPICSETPFFLMFIIFIDFCLFFSLKFMCFSKWSSVCGYFAVDFALFHSSQFFFTSTPPPPHLASSPGTWCCGHCGDGPRELGHTPRHRTVGQLHALEDQGLCTGKEGDP